MHYADATELASLIRSKQLSPVEVLKAHVDRIEAVNPRLNAMSRSWRIGRSRRQSLPKPRS